jgi:hypothetical protein
MTTITPIITEDVISVIVTFPEETPFTVEIPNEITVNVSDLSTQVPSDWNATSGVNQILNKPDVNNYVPTSRKVNNKELTGDINVTAGLDKEIQFNDLGYLGSSADFKYDKDAKAVVINRAELLPTNPLAIGGDVDNYLQVNIRNNNSGVSASSDYVATASNGSDITNYINMGIGSSTYNHPEYNAFKPNDGYLLTVGQNLLLVAGAVGKEIQMLTGGSLVENISATLKDSGFVLPETSTYKIGNFDITNLIATASSQLEEDALFLAGSKIVIRTDLL